MSQMERLPENSCLLTHLAEIIASWWRILGQLVAPPPSRVVMAMGPWTLSVAPLPYRRIARPCCISRTLEADADESWQMRGHHITLYGTCLERRSGCGCYYYQPLVSRVRGIYSVRRTPYLESRLITVTSFVPTTTQIFMTVTDHS
jgi:hypothetical protein